MDDNVFCKETPFGYQQLYFIPVNGKDEGIGVVLATVPIIVKWKEKTKKISKVLGMYRFHNEIKKKKKKHTFIENIMNFW